MNVLPQNLMRMEHFEIIILKLNKTLISQKLMDQLNWNFVCFLFSQFNIHNHTILAINMTISKLNKTQSQCPLILPRVAAVTFDVKTLDHLGKKSRVSMA